MKSITRLSLALIMFSLFSISYFVTSAIGADCARMGDPTEVARCWAQQSGAPGTAPHLPVGDDPSASGSSYQLNQPVNQGGVNGVIADSAMGDPCMIVPAGPDRVACYATQRPSGGNSQQGDPCLMVAAGPNRVACYAALASQPRN
jgi:hypothetical protein